MPRLVRKVVSGGQTGVDRAALDVATELGIECGGWCPAGRGAEDGRIDDRYPLTETPTSDTSERTAWNVRDSDGTLILARRPLVGGTAETERLAARLGKPVLVVDPGDTSRIPAVAEWLAGRTISVLNVAGPRESTVPGVYDQAATFLRALLG
ncbi:MAG TPA: putative molybdenum carrier protein [Planctomycetaceae bacterium]